LECAKLRETFKYTYVPQNARNAGHDKEILRNKAAAADCGAELENINRRFDAIAEEIKLIQSRVGTDEIQAKKNGQDEASVSLPVSNRKKTNLTRKTRSVRTKKPVPRKPTNTNDANASFLSGPREKSRVSPETEARDALRSILIPVEPEFDSVYEIPMMYDIAMKDIIEETTRKDPNGPMTDDDWITVNNALSNYDKKALYTKASEIKGYYVVCNIRLPPGTPQTYTKFILAFDEFRLTVVAPAHCTFSQLELRITKDFSDGIKFVENYDGKAIVRELPYGSVVKTTLNTSIIRSVTRAEFQKNLSYIKKTHGLPDTITYETHRSYFEGILHDDIIGVFKEFTRRVKRTEITLRLKLLKKLNAA